MLYRILQMFTLISAFQDKQSYISAHTLKSKPATVFNSVSKRQETAGEKAFVTSSPRSKDLPFFFVGFFFFIFFIKGVISTYVY